ncbi:MAG: RNA chaperone Hfq [Gammaproteobacteria bacterium]|jgi:host factor-I protein
MSENNGKKPLQETFLNDLRKNKTNVSVFMVNGIKLNGQIVSFDQFSILLGGKTEQLIYKQKISTIVPMSGSEHRHKSHS